MIIRQAVERAVSYLDANIMQHTFPLVSRLWGLYWRAFRPWPLEPRILQPTRFWEGLSEATCKPQALRILTSNGGHIFRVLTFLLGYEALQSLSPVCRFLGSFFSQNHQSPSGMSGPDKTFLFLVSQREKSIWNSQTMWLGCTEKSSARPRSACVPKRANVQNHILPTCGGATTTALSLLEHT